MNRHGHVCLDLSQIAGKPVSEGADLCYPDLAIWREILLTSPVVGHPGQYKPLIFDGTAKLYLHRYSEYQNRLASFIKSRITSTENTTVSDLKKNLDLLFVPIRAVRKSIGRKSPAFYPS